MNNIVSNIIWIIHLCIVIFVLLLPFAKSPYFLLLHTVFVPFLILHWMTNNNTCVLTTAEKYFRDVKTKKEEEDCFTCRLINPMFDFRKNHINQSTFIYVITIGLWLISSGRLFSKYNNGEINNFAELFVIHKPTMSFPPI